jgi:5-methylcytosine-specific restriction endonuclease McrA
VATKSEKGKRKPQIRHWLTNKLRRLSYQWPSRKEAIRKARIERGVYRCAICEGSFKPKEIQLDHIDPVIDPHIGFTNWDDYINRLFVGEDGWQILCRVCHEFKTKFENEIRKSVKAESRSDDDDI